jgi:hypothetical protein
MSSVEYMVSLVKKYGLTLEPSTSSKGQWISHVMSRIKHVASERWNQLRGKSCVLASGYNFIKDSPQLEWYTNHHDSYTSRIVFKLRSGSCALMVSTGRYSNVPHDERICQLCGESVEDVLHFLSRCPALVEERDHWRESIAALCGEVGIPQIHRRYATAALNDIGDLDTMRLLLCSRDRLSFVDWPGFKQWWPLLETHVFERSMKAVYKLYSRRIELLYGRPLD